MPLDSKEAEAELVWVDRKGAATPLTDTRHDYSEPRISPDGKHLAVVAGEADSDIWILDLTRGSWGRLTWGGLNWDPVWSSDGERLAFASNRSGSISMFWMPIDHSTPAEQLTKTSESWTSPSSASPDGRTLIVEEQDPERGFDLSVLSLSGDRKLRPLIHTPANETFARFSPDGGWIAYQSDESGRPEVYVAPYPGPGGRSQISLDGGSTPVWSRDGREIFYQGGGKMMATPVETRPKFRAGLPKPLFKLTNLGEYDVAPDGKRFVFVRTRGEDAAPRSLAVVLNWFEDLKRRMATEKKLP
jgi:Tol biopolymer transport system component